MDVVHDTNKKNKPVVIKTFATIFLVTFVAVGVHAGFAFAYNGKIYPGVHINKLRLGGMTRDEAIRAVNNKLAGQIENGLTFSVNGQTTDIDLDVISSEDPDLTRQIINSDAETMVDFAYSQGRTKNVFINILLPLVPMIERPDLAVPITIETGDLSARILSAFPEYDRQPDPTLFMISKEKDVWNIAIKEGSEIRTLGMETVIKKLNVGFSNLDEELLSQTIEIPIVTVKPRVSLEEAAALIPQAETILEASPFTLSYTDQRKRTMTWKLDGSVLADMLVPTKIGVDLDEEKLKTFLETITQTVNIEAQDARFEASGSRASVFIPSRDGRAINIGGTINEIRLRVLNLQTDPIAVAVDVTKPSVELSKSNELGINELLGTGVSSYAGSPTNRIKNIRNGVNLLNGILIPPGETFSLLSALSPFTTENGYLPELVIKGDKIEPETGGGLCQIGTTTFRATMMSGLEVTERRNHSLVVTYYNDQRNGNPGTDATIYNPFPDYKLTNNTEHYILFEAIMDDAEQMLYFSFWGTNDGRKGSYTEPVVEKWLGAGEQRDIETTDLPPGTIKCQGAHPGAITSFTYIVEKPDGTIEERVFTSQYRSLPKICLVGVEQITQGEVVEETAIIE